MKSPLFVVVTAVALLVTGGVLAVMNNGCKTSHHPVRFHVSNSTAHRN